MDKIPIQLQNKDFNFVLLKPKEKIPFQKDWQKKEIKFDNLELISHLKDKGNYGVIGGGEKNLVIVDFDNKEIQEEVIQKLPKTFTVQTGSGLLHKYFICSNSKSFKIFDEKLNTLIDIQGEGKQVVGPESIHPNLKKYEIIDDSNIAFIEYAELQALLIPFDKRPKKEIKEYVKKETSHDDIIELVKSNINLSEVLEEWGVDTSKNPTNCPLHSSKGGKCLGFDAETAHCFHCDGSWNIFQVIMEYKNYDFKEALEYLVIKAGLEKEYNKSKKNWVEEKNNIDNNKDEKPEVENPGLDKLISNYSLRLANILKEKNILFYRPDSKEIVEVGKLKLHNTGKEVYTGFIPIKSNRFITLIEKYITPGIYIYNDKYKQMEFRKKSISAIVANTVLSSEMLQQALPQITRIFTIPIPIIHKGKLTFPKKGYDIRFNSWLPHESPEISDLDITLEKAKESPEISDLDITLKKAKDILLNKLFKEFCFESKQDYTNAIAALLTPFLRGLFSNFNTRTPIFFYLGNRERVGKDYLAGITGIVYENHALEETPISSNENRGNTNEELRKKILAAMINGRKRLHFSNNKGFINNAVFESVSTAEKYSDRLLGKNEILTFENELDFSLSGNVGITFTPDFANRCRFITQFLDLEDANSREFSNPDLHGWVKENRELILSALFALVKNWIDNEKKPGTIPFTSFPQWAKVCGGIMEAAGYDNPCMPDKKTLNIGGDRETQDMKQLFEICYETFSEQWVKKREIRNMAEIGDNDLFSYVDFNKKADQTTFGKKISKFVGRTLSNITLILKDASTRSARQEFKFTKEKVKVDRDEIFGNIGNIGNIDTYLKSFKKKNNVYIGSELPTLPTLPPNSLFFPLEDINFINLDGKEINLIKSQKYSVDLVDPNIFSILLKDGRVKLKENDKQTEEIK